MDLGNQSRKRPCVIWKTTPTIQVLLMSRFDAVDVSDPNVHFLIIYLINKFEKGRKLSLFIIYLVRFLESFFHKSLSKDYHDYASH
jgi:hypothetical protein